MLNAPTTGIDVEATDFYRPGHRYVFAAILALLARGEPIDVVTVADELRRAGLLESVGPGPGDEQRHGMQYLHALQNLTPSISAAGHYAGIVRRCAAGRRLVHVGGDVAEAGYAVDGSQESYFRAIARAKEVLATGEHLGGQEVELIDWSTIDERQRDLVDGLIVAGRWTELSAGAKEGKSSLLVAVGIEVSEGRHPFLGTVQEPVTVLHVDAELGRFDLRRLVRDCGAEPSELVHWYATDLSPRLDDPDGAGRMLATVRRLDAGLVIIDGVNGVISGAENDDLPWRDLFDGFVRPLKADGIAVVTSDNEGHEAKRPRGSSVKLDKPDAVVRLSRTDAGVRLVASHRRTGEFSSEIVLAATGFDGATPIRYRQSAGAWLQGTTRVAELLDVLGVPITAGRDAARTTLRLAAHEALRRGDDETPYQVRNDVLASAIRWRKQGE